MKDSQAEAVKAFGVLSMQQVSNVLIGLIRNKITATLIGPMGIGLVSQMNSVLGLSRQIVTLGAGPGIVKEVAQTASDDSGVETEQLLAMAVTVVLATSLILLILCFLIPSKLAQLLFGEENWGHLVLLVGLAIPMSVLGQLAQFFMQGQLKLRQLSMHSVVTAGTSLLITIPLILLFKLSGATISITIAAAISMLLGYAYLRRSVTKPLNISLRLALPSSAFLQTLGKFGVATALGQTASEASILIIHTILIRRLGPEMNGYAQVATSLSTRYLAIIVSSIWSYGMPKAASLNGDLKAIVGVQNSLLRLSLILIVVLFTPILLFQGLWIPVLFSRDFIAASPLIPWQLAGDFFQILRWSLNVSLAPLERIKPMILLGVTLSCLRALLFWVGIDRLGLLSISVSYAVAQAIVFFPTYIYHIRSGQFEVYQENRVLFLKSVSFLSCLYVSLQQLKTSVIAQVTVIALLPLWLLWALTHDETKEISQQVRSRLRKSYSIHE